MTDAIETTPAELDGERRQDYRQWRDKVEMRLDAGAQNMREMRAEIADNTTLTKEVQAVANQTQSDTSEVVALLKSFQGAFKVFNMVGHLAKPLGYIAMATSALWGLWVTWKGGGKP